MSVRRFEHPRGTRGLLGLLGLEELVELGEAVRHFLVDVGTGVGVVEETLFFGGHGVDDGDGGGGADLLVEGFAAGGFRFSMDSRTTACTIAARRAKGSAR